MRKNKNDAKLMRSSKELLLMIGFYSSPKCKKEILYFFDFWACG